MYVCICLCVLKKLNTVKGSRPTNRHNQTKIDSRCTIAHECIYVHDLKRDVANIFLEPTKNFKAIKSTWKQISGYKQSILNG